MSKPKISPEDIERIAELASLELTDGEKAELVRQFGDILRYFEMIDAVQLPDLHDHDPDAADHLRDDRAVKSGVDPEAFSPHLENGHFKVPKVIE